MLPLRALAQTYSRWLQTAGKAVHVMVIWANENQVTFRDVEQFARAFQKFSFLNLSLHAPQI